jgi:uncharacterized caspase-like protein
MNNQTIVRLLSQLPVVFGLLINGALAQDARNLAISAKAAPTIADKRVALVIGNSAYQKSPLKNPVNDAADIAAKLRTLGFDVVERNNLKTSQIGRTLREFRSKLSNGAVALFFYAGHGLQIKGENYLPAVDADIEGEEDVPNQSIAVRQVLELMEDAKTRLNLAFLDACRNNPYSRSFRSAGEGLAKVSAPSGTLISFATRPGSVAADGSGRNGLYTTHLLHAIETPNLQVELMLKRVTTEVKGASRGMQEPWMEGSIEGEFYFRTAAVQPGMVSADSAPYQQEAIDRAVQDALRRSNEQAARERVELQQSMEKMLKEALARQNAMIEAQGGKRENLQNTSQETASALSPAITVAAVGPSTTLAATRPLAFASSKAPQPGDEWEYLTRDELFGKNRKLLWRVKAVDQASGVLEELQVDGKPVQEWVFDGKPYFLGAPLESHFVFGPHWDGSNFPQLSVLGTGDCVGRLRCQITAKAVGMERISVPAGTFDAVRFDGQLTTNAFALRYYGDISLWYSEKDRRLLRQTVKIRAKDVGFMVDETLELQAARTR